MLLSIVMMVKNEEKNIRKTLLSLENIRDKIDSELIILDTGSKDNTINIANEFTDKVFISEWNNNFASMRNKSIEYAQGEWILILDADEELIIDKELINFFNNKYYRNYKSAHILLRNLNEIDNLDEYSTALLPRLFENDGNFKYEGSIHEQPLYKEPIYKNPVGEFNHYGYIYEDEELKQNKLSRNEKLLLEELSQDSENPYINYQLGKNYISSGELDVAETHLEKAMAQYEKNRIYPDYIYENLAKVYLMNGKYKACEIICERYLEELHDCNIDILYFLAKSQKILFKLEESKKSYEKYIFYIDNYDLSTQSTSLYSEGSTISLKKEALVDIIKILYELKDFENVILDCDKYLKESDDNSEIYEILVNALYKTKKISSIKNYYDKICKTRNDTNKFIASLENLVIVMDKESKEILIRQLSSIESNYGILNKVRLGQYKDLKNYRQLLSEVKESYYGDLIYHCLEDSNDIYEILIDTDVRHMQEFINYIVIYRKSIIFKLYDYLNKSRITLDKNKIKVYKCIAKSLLFFGGLVGEKYVNVLSAYIAYNYLSIKCVYNSNLRDDELMSYISDRDEIFVLKLMNIKSKEREGKVAYIHNLKELLLEFPQYKSSIKIMLNDLRDEKAESNELSNLKEKYKSLIRENLNFDNISDALKMINEYEKIFIKDVEILNMKAIANLYSGNIVESESVLKEAFLYDLNNTDIIFNIAFLKEINGEIEEAKLFYLKIVRECMDERLVNEARKKLNELSADEKVV